MEKKIKRFLSLALALILVLGMAPTYHVHAEENAKYSYRWEMNDAGNALVSVVNEEFTQNNISKTAGSISGGTLSSYKANLSKPITLEPDEEWTIEWAATGSWSGGMFLSTDASVGAGDDYIYYNASYIMALGTSDGSFWNYGFKTSDQNTAIDMSQRHVFRLENRVGQDGKNSIWLVLDGNDFFEMTSNCYNGSALSSSHGDKLVGKTLTFGAIGNNIAAVTGMKLEYLEVNEQGHKHSYGVWTLGADGQTLEHTCATCGETQQEEHYGYRWEMNDAGDALVSVQTGENRLNELTGNGKISGGTLNGYSGAMTTPVTLMPDKEWVIEWKATGDWSGMLLSSHGSNSVGSVYLYAHRNAQNGWNGMLSFGTQSGGYQNTGLEITGIDMTKEHVFRIENHIGSDGKAMAYLYVDNKEVGPMNIYRTGSDASTVTSSDIYNREDGLTFSYLGGDVYLPTGMKLEYLQIWPNGTVHQHAYASEDLAGSDCQTVGVTRYTCSCGDTYDEPNTVVGGHIYGEWLESADGSTLSRKCTLCDDVQTEDYIAYWWQMNDTGTALENVVEGIFGANALTMTGGKIEGGVLQNNYKGSFAQSFTLDSSKEWVIEWKASGEWNKGSSSYGSMFLSAAATADGYIYYNTNRIFSIGHQYTSSSYHNFGFDVDDTTIDMTQEHTYRLENRINEDGSNEIWLVLDGTDFCNMGSNWFVGSAPQTSENDWLNGTDITIAQIGNSLCGVGGMDLEYLKVWLNTPAGKEHVCSFTKEQEVVPGADCQHVGYTVWACECGETENRPNEVYGDHIGYGLTDSTTGADCKTAGVDTYKCACGDTYTKANEKYGPCAFFGDWAYNAENDCVERTCECGKKEVAKITVDVDGVNSGYESLADAIASAPAGAVIQLWEDASVMGNLTLHNGVTLDLQGHTLTVSGYVVVDNGNSIEDFYEGTGLLKVAKGNVQFVGGNMLPIWTGEGYAFANFNKCQEMSEQLNGNKLAYYFLPEISENVHAFLAAGSETSGVELKIKMSWTAKDGSTGSETLTFSNYDELIAAFYNGYNAENGTYAQAFRLTVSGTDLVDSLSFEVFVDANCLTQELTADQN